MNSSSFQIYNLEFPGLSFQLFPWLLYTHMYPYSYIYIKLFSILIFIFPVQFSSVTQSCLILCDPMVCSMPCFTVHHQLPELAQTCLHWVSDAIHPSHPLSSPSSPAFNLPQHQGLSFPMSQFFTSSGQSIGASTSASSFQWIFRTDFLYSWLTWSSCSPRDSQESSPVPQFKSISSSRLSLLYGPTLTFIHDYWKNHSFDYTDLCWQSNVSAF